MEMIFFIICMILFAIGFYNIGRRKTVQEKEINYQQELKEKEKLILDIKNKKEQLQQIEKEYIDKKQIIEDTSNIAQREYKLREQALEEKYKIRNEQLEKAFEQYKNNIYNNFEITQEELIKQIEDLGKELKQLSDTKAATIEALQREQMLQKEKDNYRLDISQNDLNDVEILENVRPKLNRPRVLSMLIWQTFWQPLAKKKFPIILGKNEVCGIYKITNLENQKCYIGQAKDVRKRWSDHCKCGLGIDTPQGNKLYQAIQKDGLENFTFELLEECKPEQLNEKEKYYIKFYNAVDYGYNKLAGNNG